MRCQTCGRENEKNALFCVYCGIRIDTQAGNPRTEPAVTGATIDLKRAAPKSAQHDDWNKNVVSPPPSAAPIEPVSTPQQTYSNSSNTWIWYVVGVLVVIFLFKSGLWFIPLIFFAFWSNGSSSRKYRRYNRPVKHWKSRHRHRW